MQNVAQERDFATLLGRQRVPCEVPTLQRQISLVTLRRSYPERDYSIVALAILTNVRGLSSTDSKLCP